LQKGKPAKGNKQILPLAQGHLALKSTAKVVALQISIGISGNFHGFFSIGFAVRL